eukprot:g949.t1
MSRPGCHRPRMDDESAAPNEPAFVCVGDVVFLSMQNETSREQFVLGADGFLEPYALSLQACRRALDEDGQQNPLMLEPAKFRDCLFRIVPKQAFAARDRLLEEKTKLQAMEAELGGRDTRARLGRRFSPHSIRSPDIDSGGRSITNAGTSRSAKWRRTGNMLKAVNAFRDSSPRASTRTLARQSSGRRSSFVRSTSRRSNALSKKDGARAAAEDAMTKELQKQLRVVDQARQAYEHEQQYNAAAFKRSYPVKYLTDTLHLQHVKTGSFLKLHASEVAPLDSKCRRVELTRGAAELDAAHCMCLQPAGKHEEGVATYGIDLRVGSAPGYGQLHLAATFSGGDEREVNATVSAQSGQCWRLHTYTPGASLEFARTHLTIGQVVRLTAASDDSDWCVAASVSGDKAAYLQHHSSPAAGATRSAKQVFVVERALRGVGGVLRWGDEVCFRHLLSGRLLAVEPASAGDAADADAAGGLVVRLVEDVVEMTRTPTRTDSKWRRISQARKIVDGFSDRGGKRAEPKSAALSTSPVLRGRRLSRGEGLQQQQQQAKSRLTRFVISPRHPSATEHDGQPVRLAQQGFWLSWVARKGSVAESAAIGKARGSQVGKLHLGRGQAKAPRLSGTSNGSGAGGGSTAGAGNKTASNAQLVVCKKGVPFQFEAVDEDELLEIERCLSWKRGVCRFSEPTSSTDAEYELRLLLIDMIRSLFKPSDATLYEMFVGVDVDGHSGPVMHEPPMVLDGLLSEPQQQRVREVKLVDCMAAALRAIDTAADIYGGSSQARFSATRLLSMGLVCAFARNQRSQRYALRMRDRSCVATLFDNRQLNIVGRVPFLTHLVRDNDAVDAQFARQQDPSAQAAGSHAYHLDPPSYEGMFTTVLVAWDAWEGNDWAPESGLFYSAEELGLGDSIVSQQGRSYPAIMEIQSAHAFQLCIVGASHSQLPKMLRAAFVQLILTCFVDRHPENPQTDDYAESHAVTSAVFAVEVSAKLRGLLGSALSLAACKKVLLDAKAQQRHDVLQAYCTLVVHCYIVHMDHVETDDVVLLWSVAKHVVHWLDVDVTHASSDELTFIMCGALPLVTRFFRHVWSDQSTGEFTALYLQGLGADMEALRVHVEQDDEVRRQWMADPLHYNYVPVNVNLDSLPLPEGMEKIVQSAPVKMHEYWMQTQIRAGNTKSPLLVPFEELPVKHRQQNTAFATDSIKLIVALGYQISNEDGVFFNASSRSIEQWRTLVNLLACHSHESWAVSKLASGYVYGPTRSDGDDGGLKTHPQLVPFGVLAEKDREYDCNTSETLIRSILGAGFHISVEPDGGLLSVGNSVNVTLGQQVQSMLTDLKSHLKRLLASNNVPIQIMAHDTATILKQAVAGFTLTESGSATHASVRAAVHDLETYEHVLMSEVSRREPCKQKILRDFTRAIALSSTFRQQEAALFDEYVERLTSMGKGEGASAVATGLDFGSVCDRMCQFVRQCGSSQPHREVEAFVLQTLTRYISIAYPVQEDIRALEKGELLLQHLAAVNAQFHTRASMHHEFQQRQEELCERGVAELVVELVAKRESFDDAMRLGAMLVFDSNKVAQKAFESAFKTSASSARFFEKMHATLRRIATETRAELHMRKFGHGKGELHRRSLHEAVPQMMEFLQNLCEEHFHPIQMALLGRAPESGNVSNFNLVEASIDLMHAHVPNSMAARTMTKRDAKYIMYVLAFLVEVVGGPCREAQAELAHSGRAMRCLETLVRHSFGMLEETDRVLTQTLKAMALKTITAVLEGRRDTDAPLHEPIIAALPPLTLKRRLLMNYEQWPGWIRAGDRQPTRDEKIELNKNTLVPQLLEEARDIFTLAKLLGEHDGRYKSDGLAFQHTSEAGHKNTKSGRNVAQPARRGGAGSFVVASDFFTQPVAFGYDPELCSVEIMWKGQLQVHMFMTPRLCARIPVYDKEKILSEIDVMSATKIQDFMRQVSTKYREMVHQERLTNMSFRFLGRTLYAMKWLVKKKRPLRKVVFALSVVINCFLLLGAKQGGPGTRGLSDANCGDMPLDGVIGARFHFQSYNLDDDPSCANARWLPSTLTAVAAGQLVIAAMTAATGVVERLSFATETYLHHASARGALNGSSGKAWWKALTFPLLLLLVGIIQAVVHGRVRTWYITFTVASLVMAMIRNPRAGARGVRTKYQALLSCARDVLAHDNTWFYLLYLVICVLAMAVSPFFFSLQLFEIVAMSQTLGNVILAITDSSKQLLMTTMLGLVMLYTLGCYGFFFLPRYMRAVVDYGNAYVFENRANVTSVQDAFMHMVYHAIVVGSGSLTTNDVQLDEGDTLSRFAYDMCFFIVIVVILLNMIFGIIVDKFGELRDREATRLHVRTHVCFICGIEKHEFDSAGLRRGRFDAFARHVDAEHSVWSYFCLFVCLLSKRSVSYVGPEMFLRQCLDAHRLDWLPSGRALSLEAGASEGQDTGGAAGSAGAAATERSTSTPAPAGGVVPDRRAATRREQRRQQSPSHSERGKRRAHRRHEPGTAATRYSQPAAAANDNEALRAELQLQGRQLAEQQGRLKLIMSKVDLVLQQQQKQDTAQAPAVAVAHTSAAVAPAQPPQLPAMVAHEPTGASAAIGDPFYWAVGDE